MPLSPPDPRTRAALLALDAPARRALAESSNATSDQLLLLATDANLHIRRTASKHPALPAELLDTLTRAGAANDLTASSTPDPNLSQEALEVLAGLGEWAQQLAAAHPNSPADALDILADSPGAMIRRAVASNPAASTRALTRLMLDADAETRAAAAAQPQAPAETRDQLIGLGSTPDLRGTQPPNEALPIDPAVVIELADQGPWGAQLAARHPGTPAELLAMLAQHPQRAVRHALLDNPVLPPDTLTRLADDLPQNLHAQLARHPNAPGPLLDRLASCDDFPTRATIAANPATPTQTLARLAADGSHVVREAALENSSTPSEAIETLTRAGSTPDLMSYGPCDDSLPTETLEHLAAAGAWGAQLAARHPNTPAETLWRLACDANPLIREAVTRHPNRPNNIGRLIAAGSSEDLQGFDTPDPDITSAELAQLTNAGPWAARLAARHPASDALLLNRLAGHDDWQVRKAVARHNTTGEDTMLALIQDAQPDVRWSVVQRDALPFEVLDEASRDTIATIRLAIAQRADTPAAIIGRLKLDLDQDVRDAAKAR